MPKNVIADLERMRQGHLRSCLVFFNSQPAALSFAGRLTITPIESCFLRDSVELFRYRGAARDGGTLEYVFEAGEQNSPNAVTKEKVAEIAADFMTTFYHVQV